MMHRGIRLPGFLSVLLTWALAAVFATAASAATSTLHTLPPATHGHALTVGPDQAVWFAGSHGSAHESGERYFLGRLSPDGTVSEFALPDGSRAGTPIIGPGGDAWFPMIYERSAIPRIGRMSSSGHLQEYPLGSEEGAVNSVAMLNGDLWFAVTRGGNTHPRSAIGRIATSTDSAVQEFALRPSCFAGEIAAATGAIWFTESCQRWTRSGRPRPSAGIGRIDPAGNIVRHPLAKGDFPMSITAGPNGTVWFGALRGPYSPPRIGRITPTGHFAEYPVPNSWPTRIAVGPEGRLWFPSSLRALRPINVRGRLGKPICIPSSCSLVAEGLASGPDGRLWFSAGRVPGAGGGGMTTIIENEHIANESGVVGWLTP